MEFHGNVFLMLVLLSSCMSLIVSVETSVGVDTDIEALKAFKSSITPDSVVALADWIDDNHHCNWTGVACDPLSSRVVSVSLPEKQLEGEISPFLGNISSLQVLDLTSNSFTGAIPSQLGRCLELIQLVLYGNSLFGSIPVEMWYLSNLQLLDAGNNDLNGTIPESICNCTSLALFGVDANNLTEFAYTSKVTTKADVFSFGVLVMEFLTTRRPTGTIEDNGVPVTLRQFVEAMLSNGSKRLRQLVDPELALSLSSQHEEERMVALLELAVSCTNPEPANRPDMSDVLSLLLTIRDSRNLKDEQTTRIPLLQTHRTGN